MPVGGNGMERGHTVREGAPIGTTLELIAVPDHLLPCQFFDSIGVRARDEPEKRLLLAVLIDAIHCWRTTGYGSRIVRDRRDATVWLFTPKLRGGFSFELVCEGLGIEPDWFRHALKYFRGSVKMTHRHLVHTERRSHPVVIRRRVRHDRRHDHHAGSKKLPLDLPFVPV